MDRGIDLSERAPRIYEERCPECDSFMTSDSAFGCTPGGCATKPSRHPATLELRYWPDPALSAVCESIAPHEFGPEIENLGNKMIALVRKLNGLGLAASQVGVLKCVFVMERSQQSSLTLCNPILEWISERGEVGAEGCLSLPGIYEDVWRHSEVIVSYQSPYGEPGRLELSGLEARVVQHEIDHLDGINFYSPQRMNRKSRKAIESDWRKFASRNIARSQKLLAAQ